MLQAYFFQKRNAQSKQMDMSQKAQLIATARFLYTKQKKEWQRWRPVPKRAICGTPCSGEELNNAYSIP